MFTILSYTLSDFLKFRLEAANHMVPQWHQTRSAVFFRHYFFYRISRRFRW